MLNRHAAQVFKDLADFQLEKFCTPFPNLDFLLASTRIGRWLVHCISWMVMTLCWTLDIFFANHVLRLFNFGLCSTKTHPVRIGFLAQSGNQPDRIKIFFLHWVFVTSLCVPYPPHLVSTFLIPHGLSWCFSKSMYRFRSRVLVLFGIESWLKNKNLFANDSTLAFFVVTLYTFMASWTMFWNNRCVALLCMILVQNPFVQRKNIFFKVWLIDDDRIRCSLRVKFYPSQLVLVQTFFSRNACPCVSGMHTQPFLSYRVVVAIRVFKRYLKKSFVLKSGVPLYRFCRIKIF